MITLAERLLKDTCGMMSTFESNLGIEVSLPALYPNGDHVVVILREIDQDNVLLHDGGFSLQAISSMGLNLQKNAIKHIKEYSSMMGCSFEDGRVMRKCEPFRVAAAAMTVSNVCLYVASQFQVMQETKKDFDLIVKDALCKNLSDGLVAPNYSIFGASGGKYSVTAAIIAPNKDVPRAIVEAIATPKSVNGRFRHLYDIMANTEHLDVERIAVYDDNEDFHQHDYLLLQDVSNVVAFSDIQKRVRAYA